MRAAAREKKIEVLQVLGVIAEGAKAFALAKKNVSGNMWVYVSGRQVYGWYTDDRQFK